MAGLRAEADTAAKRAEDAEEKNKELEHKLLQRDQEITSLTHRLGVLEADLEKAETKLGELKTQNADGESSKMTNENLQRKVQLLEEELDAAEKNVKELSSARSRIGSGLCRASSRSGSFVSQA